MNLLDIRSWDDVRNFLHVSLPGLAVVLIGTGWVDESLATTIVGVVVAASSPLLATVNTRDGFRKWFYPVIGAVGSGLILYGYSSEATWTAVVAILTLLLGGGVATANTPISQQK